MFTDYHIHTCYSGDSQAPVKAQLDAAVSAGLTHICFTDHVDFDGVDLVPADLAARNEEILALPPQYPSLDISLGMELGMSSPESNRLSHLHAENVHLDFIIGSVHMVENINVFYPEYYQGRSKEQACTAYLEKLSRAIRISEFNVMGHYDFCTKYSPYPSRSMEYEMFPRLFDDIFRYLIESGRGIEINSSAWRDDPPWGLSVISRYRELGGEYVTIGSDAHQPQRVGSRVKEAVELAKAAGIRYIATFKNLKPIMHKI
ncbi:MAG: histidinol-phosphatase HisJ family protein [Clostridia bacterium]|nr:histidinol-phosphatase HisJ family protein [Clostridia bacterium]